jgi:hypothetical protein
MDDLTAAIRDETAILPVPSDAHRHLGHAVRSAQGWAVYDGTDPGSEECGFGETVSFPDIADAIAAIEDSVGCGRGRMGSEIARAVLIGRQTSRDGVQHNVYKMPFSKVENQTRYRN